VSTALSNFLIEALNFGILAAVLGWLVFKPIRKALDAERDRRTKAEEDLEQRSKEVARKEQEVQAAREKLEDELEQRRNQLLAEAKTEAEAVVRKAHDQADHERDTLRAELAQMRKAQVAEAADQLGDMAGAAVRRLLETLQGPELDDALVRAACTELAKLNGADLGSVIVESARELDTEARTALQATLPGEIETRVLPELGAGVRITTAAGQVDATAQAFAREARRNVAKDMRERGEHE
jgi:F-type H+-transporting ATPase subunit b